MVKLFIKNLTKACTLLIAGSIAAFALVSLSPIDPVQANIGTTAYLGMSAEKKAQMESYWGKNIPPVERYLNWAGDFLRGDMGMSLKYNRPVSEVVFEKFGNSVILMGISWMISGLLGFILGMAAGYYHGRWPDKLIGGGALLLASTPAFWLGMLLLMIFAVRLGWLPFGMHIPVGVRREEVGFLDQISHMILPALTLSLSGASAVTLHTREKMIDIMESEYVLFARARGDSGMEIVKRHALRNILLPAITLQFSSVGEIFGGSVLVEQVFSYPGLGQAAVDAGLGGDVALLLAITVASTLLVFVGNLTADFLYGMIDPGIRRGTVSGGIYRRR